MSYRTVVIKLFKKDFIYLFLEMGEEKERNIYVREKH